MKTRATDSAGEDRIDPNTITPEMLALHIYHTINDGKVVTTKKLRNILFPTGRGGDRHRENRAKEAGKITQAIKLLRPFLVISDKGTYAKTYHIRGWVTEPVIIKHLEGLA